MKKYMKTTLNVICCMLWAFAFPTVALKAEVVSYEGTQYVLNENTVILDRENVLNNPAAFNNAADAFKKVNEIGGNVTLLVAPSVYWLDDPDDPAVRTDKGGTPYAVKIECESLIMVGLSKSPENTVFAVNRGQTQGAVGNFTMFHFSGKSLITKNITYGNYCNVDLEYKRNPSFNRKKRKDAIVQAQIGICSGTDRLYADNCRFISRLNLCPFVGARRSLYQNCYFECTDDALSGSAIYLDCSFTFFSSKPFYSTAETGAVFVNCDITSLSSGTQYFTKVPGQVTVINTRFKSDNPIDIKWTRDPSDIVCYQQNVTLNGKPYIIDASRRELGPDLANSPVKDAYMIESNGKQYCNLPNLLGGLDGWCPVDMKAIISEAEKIAGKKLTGLPVVLRLITDKETLNAQDDTATLEATPLLWGGYPTGNTEKVTYVSDNRLPEPQEKLIDVRHPSGLSARQTLTVRPMLRKAPELKKKPEIRYDAQSRKYIATYQLKGKGKDESNVMWGRIVDEGNKNNVVLIKMGKGEEGNTYSPKAADLGRDIIVAVMPKFKDSATGEVVVSDPVNIHDLDAVADIPESRLITDFSDVPIAERAPGLIGAWTFDVIKPYDTRSAEWEAKDGPGWYYGKGFDASTGTGLVQDEKGARLTYFPERDSCRDMSATIVVEPAKSGGQGFGSATAQYMDICIKFDPVALDGYALRIERTPDHDKAVRFSLVRYDKGMTSVINEGVISNCFRTPCTIDVSIKEGKLRATASTSAPATKPCCAETKDKVDISAPVEENGLTGFCIQHTGSTGPSSTLIRNVDLKWDR